MRIAVGIVVLSACGHAVGPGPAAIGNAPAPPANETLGAQLERVVGQGRSVAIVPGTAGLRAISSDGVRQRLLVAGAVSWAVVDPRADVVWFGSGDESQIRAIDLEARAADPPPIETIVTGLPDGNGVSMVGPVIYGVEYVSQDPDEPRGEALMSGEAYATGAQLDMSRTHLTLLLEATPSVDGATGYEQNQDWVAAVGKAAIPGRAFLADVLARKSHKPKHAARPPDARVDGVDPSKCEDPKECGTAEVVVGTKYWRVLTASYSGDVHHVEYRLYDSEAKRFLTDEWATWLDDAIVSPDHASFLVGGMIVRFDGGPITATPRDQGGSGGGWIGGGDMYEF